MTRLTALEERYPDIPPQILLKADLVFTGIDVNQDLVDAGPPSMPHFRRVEFGGRSHVIPYFMHISDGTGTGGELLVLVRPMHGAPYRMESDGAGGYRLTEHGRPICPVRPHAKPAWYVWAERQGLRRAITGMQQHGDMLVANLTPACDYWTAPGETTNHRCLFCGYGAVSERSACLGQQRGSAAVPPETLAEFSLALVQARSETRHLYLVGGSLRDRDAEGQRYLQVAQTAVAADSSYRMIIGCGSQALPKTWSQRIRHAGAGYACHNLEVWDAALWSRVCPGKARFIGRDQWLQSMVDAVEVFGRGAVLSAFVAGAELVPPLGMSTPEQALESNSQGVDWLLTHGIVPIHSALSPVVNSEFAGAASPDLDYFLRLNRETLRLRRRHKLPVDPRFVCGGCTYAQIECDLDRLGAGLT